jgi:histidyl-tRNA synthetase
VYTDKAGIEVLGQMYVFPDRKGRQLCLRPEGTATCQLMADTVFKFERDIRLWYLTSCWRYERPQAGRYREFQQFGVEILNPRKDVKDELISFAESLVRMFTTNYQVNLGVQRGLAYYVEDGFEICCSQLGAQKQVCGGGGYRQGCGFAFGVDRLMLV